MQGNGVGRICRIGTWNTGPEIKPEDRCLTREAALSWNPEPYTIATTNTFVRYVLKSGIAPWEMADGSDSPLASDVGQLVQSG